MESEDRGITIKRQGTLKQHLQQGQFKKLQVVLLLMNLNTIEQSEGRLGLCSVAHIFYIFFCTGNGNYSGISCRSLSTL